MNLSMSLLSMLWGDSAFSPLSFLSALPAGFEKVSLSYVKDNLAVIPGEWEAGDISQFTLEDLES